MNVAWVLVSISILIFFLIFEVEVNILNKKLFKKLCIKLFIIVVSSIGIVYYFW